MNSDMCIYTHIHNYVHIHVQKQVRVRGCCLCGWVVWLGGVVWCGVVWCVDVVVSLSLVFSNLKLVRSKGFFR